MIIATDEFINNSTGYRTSAVRANIWAVKMARLWTSEWTTKSTINVSSMTPCAIPFARLVTTTCCWTRKCTRPGQYISTRHHPLPHNIAAYEVKCRIRCRLRESLKFTSNIKPTSDTAFWFRRQTNKNDEKQSKRHRCYKRNLTQSSFAYTKTLYWPQTVIPENACNYAMTSIRYETV